MYSRRSSRFVRSGFLLISCCPLSWFSVDCILYILNNIFWCYVLYIFGHLVNHIIPELQFTFILYLTSQSYSKNMLIPFKSITAVSICSLCPLSSILSGINLITSPFLVLSALKTSNDMSIDFILICSSLTSYLLIWVCVHPESTNAYSCNSFPFCVLNLLACLTLSLCCSFSIE